MGNAGFARAIRVIAEQPLVGRLGADAGLDEVVEFRPAGHVTVRRVKAERPPVHFDDVIIRRRARQS